MQHFSTSTYCHLFQICGNSRNHKQLKKLHGLVLKTVKNPDTFLFNNLISAYGNIGNVKYACSVFDEIPQRNQYSWNTILSSCSKCGNLSQMESIFTSLPKKDEVSWSTFIAGYANRGLYKKAINAYNLLVREGVHNVNRVTFATLLSLASTNMNDNLGKQVQSHIHKLGFYTYVFVGSALMDMYAKLGFISEAAKVFSDLPHKNIVMYNTMLAGLMRCGGVGSSRKMFEKMTQRDSITWTTMIAGYAQNGLEAEAIDSLRKMNQEHHEMDKFTYGAVLASCGRINALREGKQLHAHITRTHSTDDVFVGSALADMYCKCNQVKLAERVFNTIRDKNVVTWTALLVGYGKNGCHEEAIRIFLKMEENNVRADGFTMGSVISSCASLATVEEGLQFHCRSVVSGLIHFTTVRNSLINLYGKCGIVSDAHKLFDEMREKDRVSWTSLVCGCAQFGKAEDTISLFEEMLRNKMNPDGVTYIAVISACSRSGLVEKGVEYFNSMEENGVVPSVEHYACVIDLYGRAGMLEEARGFIKAMPFNPNVSGWVSLLSSCRLKGNFEIGKWASERLLEIDRNNPAAYVLMSEIHASKGEWREVARLRSGMRERGVRKEPGYSWIRHKGRVHVFSADDRSDPHWGEIEGKLEELEVEMERCGYVADVRWVRHDVACGDKVRMVSRHSERLAIAFGLLFVPRGVVIRVVKNLRVCGDCHSATKIISKITKRDILVRDSSRFHLFRDGVCSCGDFW